MPFGFLLRVGFYGRDHRGSPVLLPTSLYPYRILRCARAASGQAAAAPPMSVMNSRRLMPDIGLPPALAPRLVFRTFNLSQRGRQVLGADLNCSEARWGAADPVLPPNDSTHDVPGRPLHCGISARLMSALGQSRPANQPTAQPDVRFAPESGHCVSHSLRSSGSLAMLTAFSRARSRPTSRSNSPQDTCWLSISRPRKRWASPYPIACSPAPTR